jgi:hypothetical protein
MFHPSPRGLASRRATAAALTALVLLLAAPHAVRAAPDIEMTGARTDSVRLALVPSAQQLSAGDTVMVELVVPEAGLEFNAYDAFVQYDPTVLTFLQADDITDQEGPLMREACFQTFHLFGIAPDSTHVEINHVLLCNDTSLTGPGVLYRLQFRCKDVDADTRLDLLREAPTQTRFFHAGFLVEPLRTTGVDLRIGEGDVTATPPATPSLHLGAAPNPFNPRTTLHFSLPATASVDLRIYDLAGRHVRQLATGRHAAGEHRIRWNGRDDAGGEVPTGVYLVRLRAGGRTATERVTLVR